MAIHSNGSGAPTRLTEKKQTGDRLETQVYYHGPESDLFITIDVSRPDSCDWVVTEFHDGKVVIELYNGQNFVGTANILEFYKLERSEQWRPSRPGRR